MLNAIHLQSKSIMGKLNILQSGIFIFMALLLCTTVAKSQEIIEPEAYEKHGVAWSAGLFKSWLDDEYVGFSEIGDEIIPTFHDHHKMGFAINSHYMFKPVKWMGIGVHLGLGLDVNSYIEAPVLLFGGSLSFGSKHQFVINVGWADAKKRKILGNVRQEIMEGNYEEVPDIYDNTELNTGFYLGIAYQIF